MVVPGALRRTASQELCAAVVRVTAPKMHHDELDIDASLVRRLLASQFPRGAGLPIGGVGPPGTDNALYRLGDDMVVRLPRVARTVATLEKERAWLPRLAPPFPPALPVP